jgi:phospholipid/cholesterol/gamma-HCH transport system ATP-binding protein
MSGSGVPAGQQFRASYSASEVPAVDVRGLEMSYDGITFMRKITFTVAPREIMGIMGGSGSGKSTLMKYLVGLKAVEKGEIIYFGRSFSKCSEEEQDEIRRGFGVLFQGTALWSDRTLAENVALPLERYTELSAKDISEIVSFKLALVGLKGFEDFDPAELSGGMKKRAGLARAMALDPPLLFLDEPSAGLDPISSRRLDDLVLRLRDCLGTTFVVVTHELPQLYAIADNAIFLDGDSHTMIAQGNPKDLAPDVRTDPKVREFLFRGNPDKAKLLRGDGHHPPSQVIRPSQGNAISPTIKMGL